MINSSPASLNKFTLNISIPSEEGISFNKGEILKGQVQEIKNNGLISIFIKGKLIEAFSEVMVNKGQQLFLMVDDMKDGKVVLRVLTPELLGKIENANLANTLKEIGLPSDQNHLLVVKKLIQHNLPVTHDNIKNILRAVNMLGGLTPKNLEIAALAIAKDVPVNKISLTALAQFADGKHNISNLIKELVGLIKGLENYTPTNKNATSPVASEPRPVASNVAERTGVRQDGRVVVNQPSRGESLPGADKSTLPSNLGQTIINANLNTSSETVLKPSSTFSTMANNPVTSSIFSLLNQLTEEIVLPLKNDMSPVEQRAALVESLRFNLINEKELLRGLNLIRDILQQKENLGIDKNVITSLMDKVSDIEKELVGQRLLNVISKFSVDNNPNFYYLSFPVKVDDDYRLCQLKINKNAPRLSLEDMDHIKFIVSLETGNLGLVLFHVEWHKNKTLQLQGVVETRTVCDHIDNRIGELTDALTNMGYVVDYKGVKVAKTDEPLRLQFKEVDEDEVVKPFVIDIRV
ncbi:MAG: hypothetical protein GX790_04095 [Syntrophomonadaceae bacterium]|nr:hypothetical protein [Syntrophomonadaceae bacterium]